MIMYDEFLLTIPIPLEIPTPEAFEKKTFVGLGKPQDFLKPLLHHFT